jgi:SAM-dependent methyltransferase
MQKLDKLYWDKRYKQQLTGWDIGFVSSPLKEYIDQLENKDMRILVPGAGNAYEAEYLFNSGFLNCHILDISEEAIKGIKMRCPQFPEDQIHCSDFFDHSFQYDLIIEQTFFCALTPDFRPAYAEKMHQLLKDGGYLCGLLFDFPLNAQGPPYGGSEQEYRKLFSGVFNIEKLESCYNSIAPRMGSEFFFKCTKKL